MDDMQEIEGYIMQYAPAQQERMHHLRRLILSVCPQAKEKISWGMPTFVYHGNLVHFAQHKAHLGFYPGDTGVAAFQEQLDGYKSSKGSIQLPMDKPIPDRLIQDIVLFRMKENQQKRENKRIAKTAEKGERCRWDVNTVLEALKSLGKETTKRTYMNHGATEPLFGVTTGAMKPLAKQIKKDYPLSMALYATGNYDAMYLAGMIADPQAMTEEDFRLWMEGAYCYLLADYVVAAALAQTGFGEKLADSWIKSDKELYQSAGWSCYNWMISYWPDSRFDLSKLENMLHLAEESIHTRPNRTRYAMNGFVIAVGISCLPLHEQALETARRIGRVKMDMGPTSCKVPLAAAYIERAGEKGRLGFKRKPMYC